MDFPNHLVQLIQHLYCHQSAQVRNDSGLTDQFSVQKGTRQGCILCPRLFNLYAEREVMGNLTVSGASIGGHNIIDLRYADDTTIFAESVQELQI